MPGPLDDIAFTGLQSGVHPHRVPFEEALIASNCVTDNDAVEGRPGSRTATEEPLSDTGLFQHAGRFRPSAASARVVEVIAGEVFVVTDPSSEALSDGVATSLGTVFGTTANISGAQLGRCYYLATNETDVPWQRVVWDSGTDAYSLEALAAIPKGATPTSSLVASAWVTYRGGTFTDDGITRSNDAGSSFWVNCSPAGLEDNTYVTLDDPLDLSIVDWLCVGVAPWDSSSGSAKVIVEVAEDVSGSPGQWRKIGQTNDVPPVAGAPNILFCDMRQYAGSERNAILYIKFTASGTELEDFAIYGHLVIPSAPINNPEQYIVTFLNEDTLAESKQTDVLSVEIVGGTLPSYEDRYYASSTFQGSGTQNPIASTNQRVYNRESGAAMPSANDIGAVVKIDGTAPTFDDPATLTARLWKLTGSGYRLVTSTTVTTGAAYTMYDYGGLGVLANASYKPGGAGPVVNALSAHAGRLVGLGVGVNANRVYTSSYVPTSAENNIAPQWPDIALEDSDGWSFDIAPSPKEVGLVCNGEGDAVYICTNEACYAMTDLRPNSLPYEVFRRGAVSRFAGGYFEDRWNWLSWDGMYMAVGKSSVRELSDTFRSGYIDTFAPDCHSCIGYNGRERAIYAYTDTRYIRLYVPKKRWTDGTVSEPVRQIVSWNDQGVG